MKKRKRLRFKINEDTMTSIVVYSLLFCVAVVAAGFVFAWFGRDTSSIISSALTVFGTELGICGLMKLFDKYVEGQERQAAERRRRTEKRRAEEEARKEKEEAEREEFLEGMRKNEF